MAKTSNTFISKHTVIEELNPMTKIFAVFSLGLGSLIFPGSWLGLAVIIGLFVTACLAGILKDLQRSCLGSECRLQLCFCLSRDVIIQET